MAYLEQNVPSQGLAFWLQGLLLGKLLIPKVDEEVDEKTYFGKKKSMIIKSNDIACHELIFLINVMASSGKVAFKFIKGCHTKDYPGGNGAVAWGDSRINMSLFLSLKW
jgi:hypothetical protein